MLKPMTLAVALVVASTPAMAQPTRPTLDANLNGTAVANINWQFNTAMSDEFDGSGALGSKWTDDPTAPGWCWEGRVPVIFLQGKAKRVNGELYLEGGKLSSPKNNYMTCSGSVANFTHFGSSVRSVNPVQEGMFFEARMKANKTLLSSTFWLKSAGSDAVRGELDIQECVGRISANMPYSPTGPLGQFDRNMHSNVINSSTGVKNSAYVPLGELCSANYHTYGMWWKNSTTMNFYLDGKYKYTISAPAGVTFNKNMWLRMVVELYDWNPFDSNTDLDTQNYDFRTTKYQWVRVWNDPNKNP